MKRRVIVVLTALLIAACGKLAIAPQQPSPPPGPPKLIWSGQSAGFTIRWTASDIIASPVGAPTHELLSGLGLTIFDFHIISHQQSSDCDFVRVMQLQSVVGPIVSLQDDDTMKCTNGATGLGRKVVAVDLTHPGQPASLSEFFSPTQLAPLLTRAAHACTSKVPDLARRFSFVSLEAKDVTVRLTLPPGCSTPNVDAPLPVPAKLRAPLVLAASRKQGFLAGEQAKISGGQTTTINYHYRLNGT